MSERVRPQYSDDDISRLVKLLDAGCLNVASLKPTALLLDLRDARAERDAARERITQLERGYDELQEMADECMGQRDAARADAERLAAAGGVLMDRIEALENLLACYRVKRTPSEALYRRLAKTSEAEAVWRAAHAERVKP